MKNKFFYTIVLLLLLLMITSGLLFAQQRVTFTYDAAGNRISRTIVLPNQVKEQVGEKEGIAPFSDKINQLDIDIYPNPTQGYLSVNISGLEEDIPAALSLYNMQGVIINRLDIQNVRTDMNMSGLPAGTYLLVISIDKESTTWKIIKE